MTNSNPAPKPKKPWWKKWWVILLIIFGILFVSALFREGSTSNDASTPEETTVEQAEETTMEEQPEEEATPERPTVKHSGQEWECQPVPDDTMSRIMGGDKWDDGAHATVDKAVMVQGADNYFIAANITWEGEDEPFAADFTAPIGGSGPITSASPGTAKLFNWPETPGGPFDGTDAAKECLAQ
ncbi:hypothetical protein [Corynebacterium striatum]|uniref:hypothetical protein n=1 Tax=Corynebacterium striatum TaxID=43770 RepID=UPI00101CD411|nr:hypothetical protein [Corynebacterium striatum]